MVHILVLSTLIGIMLHLILGLILVHTNFSYILIRQEYKASSLPLGKTNLHQMTLSSLNEKCHEENFLKWSKDMKRYNNFYHKIYNRGNLLYAHKKARKNKSHYTEVKFVDENLDICISNIQNMLKFNKYELKDSDYTYMLINDKGKERDLYKLHYYPHRIIQWAIVNVVSHVFMKDYIHDTYASIKGRGIHKLLTKLKKVLKQDKENTQYCLKIDIKKFYPNINNDILMKKLERKFKDTDFLNLIRVIIFSRGSKGQPIGSLLSQYLGNFYLSSFDHYCKEQLRLKYYFRYMDDIVILHKDKQYLHTLKRVFDDILHSEYDLEIKQNWQISPSSYKRY